MPAINITYRLMTIRITTQAQVRAKIKVDTSTTFLNLKDQHQKQSVLPKMQRSIVKIGSVIILGIRSTWKNLRKLKGTRWNVNDKKILRKSRQRKSVLPRSKKESDVKRSDKKLSEPLNSWLCSSSKNAMKKN